MFNKNSKRTSNPLNDPAIKYVVKTVTLFAATHVVSAWMGRKFAQELIAHNNAKHCE